MTKTKTCRYTQKQRSMVSNPADSGFINGKLIFGVNRGKAHVHWRRFGVGYVRWSRFGICSCASA